MFKKGDDLMSNYKIVKVTREELYRMVWSKPVTKWAAEFGLSDVGFAKICKKMKVPVPRRGYWAMIKKGIKPALPGLKSVHDPNNMVIEIKKRLPKLNNSINATENDPLVLFEMMPENRIVVPGRIISLHPLVKMTGKSLRARTADQYGRIINKGLSCLNLHVSKTSLTRAMRIMDTLIKALEKREMKIIVEQKAYPNTTLFIHGEKLEFCIEESSKKIERQKTKSELKEAERYPSLYSYPAYNYKPTGELQLSINTYTCEYIRKAWHDTKSRKLEDCLNEIIIGFIKAADEIKKYRLKREQEEKEKREREQLYEEIQRQKDQEERRFNELLSYVNLWTQSQRVRKFIQHVTDATIEKYGIIQEGSDLEKWITWANIRAQEIDPTMKIVNRQDT